MGSGVLGQVNIVLEAPANQGETNLLPLTAVAGTMSLINGIPAAPASGYRLHFYVQSNTATGTFTMNGKDPSGNTISETIPPSGSIPIPDPTGQNANVAGYEYESKLVYGSTTAISNAITTTGLTNGSIKVGAVAAGKFLLPCDLDFSLEPEQYQPNEHRGSYDQDFVNIQLRRIAIVSKLDQDFYPETSLWFWYMITGQVPTITTLPASPTALKASTAVSTTPQSLTTQPTGPGMLLQFVLTAVGATGTIGITGLDINGAAQNETLTIPNVASQTVYSTKVYSAVNASGIVYTGMTGGSAAINGAFGLQYVFLPANTDPYTAAIEFFTGTDSGTLPFSALSDGSLEWAVEKPAKLTNVKGIAQDFIPIGDRTITPLATNQITSLGIPTDQPLQGTNSVMWIDPITGTPATTLYNDLISGKIDFKHEVFGKWTSSGTGPVPLVYNRIYRKKRLTTGMITIDFRDNLQYEQFRKNRKQYYALKWIGRDIGGGFSKSLQIILPVYIQKFQRKPGVEKENVEADIEFKCVYDPGIGATYKIVLQNQNPPTYTS
jgi:hypothetical protein